MAGPLYYDRVLETTTTTGTGTLTLAGAVAGYQTWAVLGNGNTSGYYIEAVDANGIPTGDWETGIGTYTSSGTTLARTTVRASSNSNNAVSFSAGTKRVGMMQITRELNVPACVAQRTTNQSISHASFTAINFNASDLLDTDAMHDTVTNNDRIVFKTPGLYQINGFAGMEAVSSGGHSRWLIISSSTSVTVGANVFIGGGVSDAFSGPYMTASGLFLAAANDYVTLQVYQDSGSSVNCGAATCSAVWVGPGQ